jgi:uncharacterized protein with WD repeat|tara:strand:+ start:274 stop:894 length:621 start_codon:yes stop_codon:yes gene_type:complete
MAFVTAAAIGGGVKAVTGIASGLIGAKGRKREQRNAQNDFNRNKTAYENLDTSNVYSNMENTMEDLTVNTQQADMANQQNNQNLSNIMGSMGAAAGGSGVAGLAQAMAQQQSANNQQASASIGQQESQNQMKEANMGAQLQNLEARGETQSRAAEKDKVETMYGQSQNRVKDANAAIDQQNAAIMGGVGELGGIGMNHLGALGKFG